MQRDRRVFIQAGATGLLGLFLSQLAGSRERTAAAAPRKPAESCIVLWLNGGPSHVDTFDPKDASLVGGSFKAIRTRAHGLELCETLPRLAERAHRLAVVRSMTSREGNHQRARFLLHTGYSPNTTVQHPGFGAWVGKERQDPARDLPAFVSIAGPSEGGGFLGVEHGPFVVARADAPPANTHKAKNVDDERLARRREALSFLEVEFAEATGDGHIAGRAAVYEKAVRLMRSPALGAFDLAAETEATKRAYGDTDFGRGCLLARRLVEAGVAYVEVALDGWDTHQNNAERTKALAAVLDEAMSGLLDDLAARHLLERTLVVCMGEFGRTPTLNAREGRDHYPAAWSAVLAGGRVRGGRAYGQTDEAGAHVVGRSTSVPDLFATIATLLGIDPAASVTTRVGRPIAVTDSGLPLAELIAG